MRDASVQKKPGDRYHIEVTSPVPLRAYDVTLLVVAGAHRLQASHFLQASHLMNARMVGLIALLALVACTGRDSSEPARSETSRSETSNTPLPTRQTTIDPVTKKLDTAREDAERRRQQVDDASK